MLSLPSVRTLTVSNVNSGPEGTGNNPPEGEEAMNELKHNLIIIDEGHDTETDQLGCCLVSFGYLF
jgi:hypothetical protein